jgi:integrase
MDPPPLSVFQLVELFLLALDADVRAGRNQPGTHVYYKLQLHKFADRIGRQTAAEGLRRIDILPHVGTWHEIQAVQRMFRWACDEEPPLVTINPAKKIKRPTPGQRTRTLTRAEQVLVRRHAPRHIRDLLTMMEETLARPQECRPLRWDEMRADGKVFALTEFKAKRRRKDGVAVRTLGITPRLRRLLVRLRRRMDPDFGRFVDGQGVEIPISPRRATQLARLRNPGIHPEILLGTKGQPLQTSHVCKSLRLIRAKLGLNKGEPVVFYTWRHTGGTRATRNGIRDARLAYLMGHSSTRTTAKYQHLDADDVISAIDAATAKK